MIHNSGLIIIYIGDGKGKTTAAVGLCVRAAGAGKRVLFAQFVKAAEAKESGEWPPSGEVKILKSLSGVMVKVLGRGFVGILGDRKQKAEHAVAARQGLDWLKKEIEHGEYDVVIADELISAIESDLLTEAEVLEAAKSISHKVEAFAMTGHNKYNGLIEAADLVTEMKMVKHPYYKGVMAKEGIDY